MVNVLKDEFCACDFCNHRDDCNPWCLFKSNPDKPDDFWKEKDDAYWNAQERMYADAQKEYESSAWYRS